jgi:hypothetical protein
MSAGPESPVMETQPPRVKHADCTPSVPCQSALERMADILENMYNEIIITFLELLKLRSTSPALLFFQPFKM